MLSSSNPCPMFTVCSWVGMNLIHDRFRVKFSSSTCPPQRDPFLGPIPPTLSGLHAMRCCSRMLAFLRCIGPWLFFLGVLAVISESSPFRFPTWKVLKVDEIPLISTTRAAGCQASKYLISAHQSEFSKLNCERHYLLVQGVPILYHSWFNLWIVPCWLRSFPLYSFPAQPDCKKLCRSSRWLLLETLWFEESILSSLSC